MGAEVKTALINEWSETLKIPAKLIHDRLEGTYKNTSDGRPLPFTETFIRQKCADLLGDFPQCSEAGSCMYRGMLHGTLSFWKQIVQSHFKVSGRYLEERLENVKGFKARGPDGFIMEETIFSGEFVQNICHNFLHPETPRVGKSGFIVLRIDGRGRLYGTQTAWTKKLGLGRHAMRKRFARCTKVLSGSNLKGQQVKLYDDAVLNDDEREMRHQEVFEDE